MARTRERERHDDVVVLEDNALLHHAVAGDSAAFDELYRRHAESALRVAYAVLTNKDDAADAVSEAFIKVLRVVQEGRFPPGVAFRPYLLVAARNSALDIGRGRTRQQRTVEKDQPSAVSGAASPASADFVLDGVDAQFVASAFAKLPERWRSVLWLTEVEGVPAREAAPILGLSANGVAQLAVRARNGLRNAYLQVHLQGHVDEACKPFVADLGAYVGGALTAREIAKVDQHIAGCDACRDRRDELEDLRTTLRRIAFPLPIALAGAVAARWKLASAAGNAVASSVAPTIARVGPDALMRMRTPLTAGATVIAGLGIIFLGVHDGTTPTTASQEGSRPRASISAPQAIVDGFDLRLEPITSRPEDDALLTSSPRLAAGPQPPAVASQPGVITGPPASPPPPNQPNTSPPPKPVPLAQADVGVPAADTQASVGAGAGSCTSLELTLLDVGDCPAPSGSGPVNIGLGGSLLGRS
ncbi:MAG TPA: sigma-70 family RNA polymerase sigma factor [Acidimicrobiales bacterium]|nr:sigma-70 family RNA polymerase sigma factor [Acidimicrobiales bacterium]